MKKQLLISTGILIVVFFSVRFAAAAAKVDTSVSLDYSDRSNAEKNIFTNTVSILPTTITMHLNYASIYPGRFNADKRWKYSPSKSLAGLPRIPIFNLPGNNRKIALLSITKEKVVFGAPSHKRFNYPAIAFRVKF